MAYVPYEWVDGQSGGTPITAARLNHMEQGLVDASLDGPNVELAFASVPGPTALGKTVNADMPGMSVTVATGDRPAMVEVYPGAFYASGQTTIVYRLIRNSDAAELAIGIVEATATANYPPAVPLKYRIPAGTAPDTYKLQAWVMSDNLNGANMNPASRSCYVQVVSV